jgi:hypothetical protein
VNNLPCAPVLLTVFNRPRETGQVLDRLKLIRPDKILIAADGPRVMNTQDYSLCEDVRRLVLDAIDWRAEVKTEFASTNLGLRKRMASAISWALEQYDRVIVLEDDCLPDPTFFRFCTELLDRYNTEHRVGAITGDNFQSKEFDCGESYYFSRYPHCWGWATWRRAWRLNDNEMSDWPQVRETSWLDSIFREPLEALYWHQLFDDTYSGKIDTWDYQWTYACWRHHMLTATPCRNLVTNVGIGEAATNTRDVESDKHHRDAFALAFPLRHPLSLSRKKDADCYAQQTVFGRAKDPSLLGRMQRLAAKIWKLPHRVARGWKKGYQNYRPEDVTD